MIGKSRVFLNISKIFKFGLRVQDWLQVRPWNCKLPAFFELQIILIVNQPMKKLHADEISCYSSKILEWKLTLILRLALAVLAPVVQTLDSALSTFSNKWSQKPQLVLKGMWEWVDWILFRNSTTTMMQECDDNYKWSWQTYHLSPAPS